MWTTALLSATFSFLYQYADMVTLLLLSAAGLTIIFGMMGIINMAHGELMLIGAYSASVAYYAGVPLAVAILVGALMSGIFGIILERLVIRRFYGQLLSSLVVTWGLSLVLSQGFLVIVGPSVRSLPTPFGNFTLGGYTYSYYRLAMLSIAALIVFGVWTLFRVTRFGVEARATIEKPEIARALGVHVDRIYMLTFGLGSALAGIAGGLFALQAPIEPTFGQHYTPIAFITVVVGGEDMIGGLIGSALSLAGIGTLFTSQFNILIGYLAILSAAFVLIRFRPGGVSELLDLIRRSRFRDKTGEQS